MAVLAEYRKRGFGSKLLQFILDIAHKQNIEPVYLHAQVSAISFYEKLGFTCQGEVFFEAGIPHREMFRKSAK
jgi:predicted GNAT family N-acyltransferase